MVADETKHEYWMQRALDLAKNANQDIPIGCLILDNNRQIIGSACNQKEVNQDPTAHAEILAIREASKYIGSWRLDGCILYTTLEPCPMCAEAIIQSRLNIVVFGASDQLSGAFGSAINLFSAPRPYPKPEIVSGILEEECRKLLTDFFKTRRQENKRNENA
jgi:tRNA(adenine34) deaminase